MLVHDKHNKTRARFLEMLSGGPWSSVSGKSGAEIEAIQAVMKPWVEVQKQELVRSLRKPTVQECSWLIKLAHEHGGIDILEETRVHVHM